VPLETRMPVWPGNTGVRLLPLKRMADGDTSNLSAVECGLHTGTHVDAPGHFIEDGATVEQMSLDTLIGRAHVAHLPEAGTVTADTLAGLALPEGTTRLLLRTRNSELWEKGVTEFRKDFTALTGDAAQWLVDHGLRLVGVDYLSVQHYGDSPLVHQVLLRAGIVIVEGLNLARVPAGEYELICLPPRLVGAEGAPARAILRTLPG